MPLSYVTPQGCSICKNKSLFKCTEISTAVSSILATSLTLDAIASPYVPRCFSSSDVVVILSMIQAEDDLANCENVAAVRNL